MKASGSQITILAIAKVLRVDQPITAQEDSVHGCTGRHRRRRPFPPPAAPRRRQPRSGPGRGAEPAEPDRRPDPGPFDRRQRAASRGRLESADRHHALAGRRKAVQCRRSERRVSFQVSTDPDEVVTVFTDKSTGKEIMQFPSQALIALAEMYDKDAGKVLDKSV